MRITRTAIVLPALALAMAAGWPQPGPAHVPAAAKRCTQGTIGESYNAGPPATFSSWWESNGCSQYQSPELLDAAGQYHYGDYWRTSVNVTSVASSPNKMSKGWDRYKNTSGGQIYCHRIYPTPGTGWFKANGSVC